MLTDHCKRNCHVASFSAQLNLEVWEYHLSRASTTELLSPLSTPRRGLSHKFGDHIMVSKSCLAFGKRTIRVFARCEHNARILMMMKIFRHFMPSSRVETPQALHVKPSFAASRCGSTCGRAASEDLRFVICSRAQKDESA